MVETVLGLGQTNGEMGNWPDHMGERNGELVKWGTGLTVCGKAMVIW